MGRSLEELAASLPAATPRGSRGAWQGKVGSRQDGKGGKGGWQDDKGGKGGRGGARGGSRQSACFLDKLPPGQSLLGGACDFCDAFFHVRATPEGTLPLCCIRQPNGECEGRNTVLVARLLDADGKTVLTARYHNRDKNHHAERVMMEDETLLVAMRAMCPPATQGMADTETAAASTGKLCAYISVQPCHHSSSNPSISCTQALLGYHEHTLAPLGVAFELAIAYPYRAHCKLSCAPSSPPCSAGGCRTRAVFCSSPTVCALVPRWQGTRRTCREKS